MRLIYFIFLSIMLFSFSGFAEDIQLRKIQKWILYAPDIKEKWPVVAVFPDEKDMENIEESFEKKSHPRDYKKYKETFRILPVKYSDFSKEFFYLVPKAEFNSVELFFFHKNGVFLCSEKIKAENALNHTVLKKWEEIRKDFIRFQNTRQSSISPLFWPNAAYLSAMPHLTLRWLRKVNQKKLSAKEQEGYQKLKKLVLEEKM